MYICKKRNPVGLGFEKGRIVFPVNGTSKLPWLMAKGCIYLQPRLSFLPLFFKGANTPLLF